jgi:hypothetical protein
MSATAPMTLSGLGQTKAELADLEAAWRALHERQAELMRGGTLTTRDLDGRERRRTLDEVERTALSAEIEGERGKLATRLLDARERVQAAKIASANEKLSSLSAQWEAASESVSASRRKAEQALARLTAALFELADARRAESKAARVNYRVAAEVLEDEDERRRLRSDLDHDVPVGVAEDGVVSTVSRPATSLFDGDERDDPFLWLFWPAFGQLFSLQPEAARRQLAQTKLGELVAAIDNEEAR